MRPAPQSFPSGLLVTAILAATTIASRAPFTSSMLYAYDSANYAFAVRDYYHVGHHQPHPPGYPLYVASAWLINRLVDDPNRSLVVVSILASAVAVAATHRLGVAQFDGAIGLAAALLLAFSPGFWAYGEVAFPYTTLACFAACIALLAHHLRATAFASHVAGSGALMGLAAGFRLDLLFELGPLWARALLRCSSGARLLAVAACLLVVGAWAAPMVWLSGGASEYLAAFAAQARYVVRAYSVAAEGEERLRYNVELLLQALRLGVGAPVLLLLLYSLGRTFNALRIATDERLRFLLVWILPPSVVFLFIHIAVEGYVLVLLPALSILAAAGLADLRDDLGAAARVLALTTSKAFGLGLGRLAAAAPGVILLVLLSWNISVFLAAPGPARLSAIRRVDDLLESQVAFVQRQLSPGSTVILAHDRFRQLQYYLTGYQVVMLFDEYERDYQERRQTFLVPDGATHLLIADDSPRLGARATARLRLVDLLDEPGGSVRLIDLEGVRGVEFGYGWVELSP